MRELDWDGYPNARDLGGLPTPLSPTGQTIAGRVARGPRRELLSATGWSDARQWGLSTIVDLRCLDESGRRDADPRVAPEAWDGIAVVESPTEDHTNEAFREACFPILDSPAYWEHNWRILPDLVRDALVAIAAGRPGVLVHCSAGRDRTGMITTLLLGNAGVAPDVIAGDYAESVRIMASTPSHAPTVDRQSTWTTVDVDAWIAHTSPIVERAAMTAETTLDRLGVTVAQRDRLRALLVSPHFRSAE